MTNFMQALEFYKIPDADKKTVTMINVQRTSTVYSGSQLTEKSQKLPGSKLNSHYSGVKKQVVNKNHHGCHNNMPV